MQLLLNEVVSPDLSKSLGEEREFDINSILGMDTIRTHIKADDTPQVTDDQLDLYRRAALEQAEQYSSLFLMKTRHITEKVRMPKNIQLRKSVRHILKYQPADQTVYVQTRAGSYMMHIEPGERKIYVLVQVNPMGGRCCEPGFTGEEDSGTTVQYMAGFSDPSKIPAGIIQGCLKYIAWSVTNPGDVMMTVRNTQKANNMTIIGSNNAAWASGALELWRQYADEEY